MADAFELKREIRRLQLRRRFEKSRHELAIAPYKRKLKDMTSILQKTTTGQRLNKDARYQEVLEDVVGPCREKEEYRLLEASHMVDINQNLLELMVQQYRHLTNKMVGEISTLQEESEELKDSYLQRSCAIMEEMTSFTDSFGPLRDDDDRRSSSRRSSIATTKRQTTSIFRRQHDHFDDDDDDSSDDQSLMSDLSTPSMSVASYINLFGVPTKMTDSSDERTYNSSGDDYTAERHHIKEAIPEDEQFTVIKL